MSQTLTVYPRACGGTVSFPKYHSSVNGLSPRVRGNHQSHAYIGAQVGSIPARAGEP